VTSVRTVGIAMVHYSPRSRQPSESYLCTHAFASTPKSLNRLRWKTCFLSFFATRRVVTRTASA